MSIFSKYVELDKKDESKDIKKYGSQASKSKGAIKKMFNSIKKDEIKHHKKLSKAKV
mgnify:CR=1 FL=1|tara:strand:- start:527 stop:697 length:171 start_codon:yes stop_codon:yes gene_type:complete